MTDWQEDPDASQGSTPPQAPGQWPPPPPQAPGQWPAPPPQAPGQWPAQQQPPAQWPVAYGTYEASPVSTGRKALIGAGAVALVVALVGAVAIVGRSNDVTSSSPLSADSGKVVFTDDFTDGSWPEGSLDDGSTFAYGPSGYVITGSGYTDLSADPPTHYARRQLSVAITASQTDSGPETGFGVTCHKGYAKDELSYEFLVLGDGSWYIQRRTGGFESEIYPAILASGADATPAGETPLTVVGICAGLDDETTRIVMFVDGVQVADETDTRDSLPSGAWLGGVMVSAVEDGPTVTITRFEVRDLTD